jgi:tRNA A-37 threonylcarbamoyl transferase component Bud32
VAFEPGQTVGNYRILSKIGTGGMGAVYLAEHPLIGKRVALKVIHRELAGNREVISRFFNEARAVNKIGNEHIVEIHDFGQSPQGEYFFIMEYLEGQTLAAALQRGVFEMQRALHVGEQIAGALAAAHAQGIIHRDLKPDNIMLLTKHGDPDFVKILDFGLAKMFQEGSVSLTAAGVVLGTPQYMSPEACESKRDVDHRTDIYALGVLMFQMLTGVVPFDGQSMGEILIKQVMHAPPAPRAMNPNIAPSVEQIILRCLAKSPDGRFPTMVSVQGALLDPERYLASSPPVMPASIPPASAQARTLFLDNAEAPPPMAPAHGAFPLRAPPPSMIGQLGPGGAQVNYQAAGGLAYAGTGAMPIVGDPTAADIQRMRRATGIPGMQMPVVPQNNTMVIGTPAGYKDRPPRRTWPYVLIGAVVMAVGGASLALLTAHGGAAAVQPGGGGTVVTGSALSGSGSGSGNANGASGSGSVSGGSGSGSSPPSGSGSGSAAVNSAGSGGAVPAVVVIDAGALDATPPDASSPDAAPVARTVTLTLDTAPSGAEVFDGAGQALGKTPLQLTVPASSTPLALVFKHDGMKDKSKSVLVSEDRSLTVDLEPAQRPAAGSGAGAGTGAATPPTGSGHGSGHGTGHGSGHGAGHGSGHGSADGSGNGIMAPDF